MAEFDPSKAEFSYGQFTYGRWGKASDSEKFSDSGWVDIDELDDEEDELEKEANSAYPLGRGESHTTPLRPLERNTTHDSAYQGGAPGPVRMPKPNPVMSPPNQEVIEDASRLIIERMMQRKARETDTDISINRRQIDLPNRMMIKSAQADISNPDVNAIYLSDLITSHWGEDWMEWEPETIIETAKQDGIDIPSINLGKLFAIRACRKTSEHLENPRVFEKIALAFASRVVDFGIVQRPRVHDVAVAAALIKNHLGGGEFKGAISSYIAGLALDDGYVMLPSDLMFANDAFVVELAMNLGEEALIVQDALVRALEAEDPELVPNGYIVQYMRLVKCHLAVEEALRNTNR